MGRAVNSEWRKLPLSLKELCIDTTLRCGQAFRWRKLGDEWSCTLYGRIVSLKQDSAHLHYKITWPGSVSHGFKKGMSTSTDGNMSDFYDDEALLRHYLSLKVDLETLYQHWSKVDPVFQKKASNFSGVRILSQDSWETLIGFICSSNNNISRISQMVHKLCVNYGPLLGLIGDEPFHDFPTPDALTGPDVESKLRSLGFGYRAKYIAKTAQIVAGKPPGWLDGLRNPEYPSFWPAISSENGTASQEVTPTYKDAHRELLQLSGVGPKVADCVCLMGLGWAEAVPVDTHVWQIAQRDYKYGKAKQIFSMSMYEPVGDFFRTLWGKEAGWAHSVLFTADLKAFSDRNTPSPRKTKKRELVDVTEIKMEAGDDATFSEKRRRVAEVNVKVENEVKTEVLAAKATIRRKSSRNVQNK